jgi:hypothetical protein
MFRQTDDLTTYFRAACALRSDSPDVRRPAIGALLELSRQATGPIRARAERALTEQFGPYAVSEGLPGCSAPIGVVEACDGDCRSCVWLWLNEEAPVEFTAEAGLPALDAVPAMIAARP